MGYSSSNVSTLFSGNLEFCKCLAVPEQHGDGRVSATPVSVMSSLSAVPS